MRFDPRYLAVSLCLIAQATAGVAMSTPPPSGCAWGGPPVEWVLARHLPAGGISGALRSDVIPYLRRSGIPVSFVAATTGDERLRLDPGSGATMRDALQQIEQQLPEYRYATIDGRIVIYPRGEVYDSLIDLGQQKSMTRAAAYFYVLRALRDRASPLQKIFVGLSGVGGGWGKNPMADLIEVGGSRTLIGQLVSLVQKRPTESFDLAPMKNGWLGFQFVSVSLVTRLELRVPPRVHVGEAFAVEVTGKLADGTVVSLAGAECGVAYASGDSRAVEIDDIGHAVARRPGTWQIVAMYEELPELHAQVEVE